MPLTRLRLIVVSFAVLVSAFFGILSGPGHGKEGDRQATLEALEQAKVPLWTSTGTRTARENAVAHWEKHKAEFPEYDDAEAYIAGVHEFFSNPPPGTLKKRRRNGDQLQYHPESNTFAVRDRRGAPRTMFRPRNGMRYWNRQ